MDTTQKSSQPTAHSQGKGTLQPIRQSQLALPWANLTNEDSPPDASQEACRMHSSQFKNLFHRMAWQTKHCEMNESDTNLNKKDWRPK